MEKIIMISQPMNGKTDEEIEAVRGLAKIKCNELGYEVVNSYLKYEYKDFIDNVYVNKPIYFLSKSIEFLSHCDTIYMCKGWENARGCKIEHEVAKQYGLEIIYEE